MAPGENTSAYLTLSCTHTGRPGRVTQCDSRSHQQFSSTGVCTMVYGKVRETHVILEDVFPPPWMWALRSHQRYMRSSDDDIESPLHPTADSRLNVPSIAKPSFSLVTHRSCEPLKGPIRNPSGSGKMSAIAIAAPQLDRRNLGDTTFQTVVPRIREHHHRESWLWVMQRNSRTASHGAANLVRPLADGYNTAHRHALGVPCVAQSLLEKPAQRRL